MDVPQLDRLHVTPCAVEIRPEGGRVVHDMFLVAVTLNVLMDAECRNLRDCKA